MLRSGEPFSFTNPQPEDIHVEDIAYALSNLCRFGGHSAAFYSVAEHSIHCSMLVKKRYAMQALLHDATEAYVGDVVAPLKSLLPEYKQIEKRVWAAISEKFGLPSRMKGESSTDLDALHYSVHEADMDMLMVEARDLLLPLGTNKFGRLRRFTLREPIILEGDILPMTPQEARYAFLARYQALGGELSA